MASKITYLEEALELARDLKPNDPKQAISAEMEQAQRMSFGGDQINYCPKNEKT